MNQMQQPLTGLLVFCLLPPTIYGNAGRVDGNGGHGTTFTGVLLAPAQYYPPSIDRVWTHMHVLEAPLQCCAARSRARKPLLLIVTALQWKHT